ncbi:hypothetical protein MPPM_3846 [Methylorubrum populi]|uniref:Uncharacterized protein n=1 Tax=Methylorubrum populi TaxID=223967 RepID=A0A160PJZ6_9HYPH|nr:hypothetical protein MPPM_3846 [Methylorubrum populi]
MVGAEAFAQQLLAEPRRVRGYRLLQFGPLRHSAGERARHRAALAPRRHQFEPEAGHAAQLVDHALADHRQRFSYWPRIDVAQVCHSVDAHHLQFWQRGTTDAPQLADVDPAEPVLVSRRVGTEAKGTDTR